MKKFIRERMWNPDIMSELENIRERGKNIIKMLKRQNKSALQTMQNYVWFRKYRIYTKLW